MLEETRWPHAWPPPGDGWTSDRKDRWRRIVAWAPERRDNPFANLGDEVIAELARVAVASVPPGKRPLRLSIIADPGVPPPLRWNIRRKNSYTTLFERGDKAASEWIVTAMRAGYHVRVNDRGVT